MNNQRKIIKPILACLFAAMISVGAYISFPVPGSPVPVVLQNFFVMMTALVLGPVWGTAATLAYLGLGALGLPVFSGGHGGIARFIGPTGGYLAGYIAAVPLAGLISRIRTNKPQLKIVTGILGALAFVIVDYAFGVPWLKITAKLDWVEALAAGFAPFILVDIVKACAAGAVSPRLSSLIDEKTSSSGTDGNTNS